ncbi:N-alpha-acetyltransferase 15/16 [Rhodnius prolixus]
MPSSNPLPPKENSLFKRIIKCYEHKQYKNGLKFAKQILANPKFAEHGETLAMKGLITNCLGRKEEAYELVRRGLRNDLKSHVCWHVYGLLQRSDKKYDEAIKCYRNALKWDRDNIQILRDLSLLQIQMRDLEGYRDTRYQLFMLRPSQRVSWLSFAMAYHLLKDYEMALKILDCFMKTQTDSNYDYEHSELLLYQNMVIRESGDAEGALKHLFECRAQICDNLSVEETIVDLLLKLGKGKEAEEWVRKLLERNHENTSYYDLLARATNKVSDSERLELLLEFKRIDPKTRTPARLILNYAHGTDFVTYADEYLSSGLRKGVPSLFVDVRSLYKDSKKADILGKLVLSYEDSLMKRGTLHADKEDLEKEPPSTLLWTYFYLSQHYDYQADSERAMKYIDMALDHTPTLIELLVAKAKIYKHAGNVYAAYSWAAEAQSLDTADRYVNSKCAKYMLRADKIMEAEDMCSRFTREGVPAMENLNEMQCMWFQTECALAYQRLGNYGEALKKCHEIDRHFSAIIDDQFDFHTYCMRKMTLRSYVGLLRLEDVLRSHRFYQRAARCAIEVYLTLYDKPIEEDKTEDKIKEDNMAPAELKKLRNKQRKAQRRAERQQAEASAAEKREQHNKARQTQGDQDDSPVQEELIPEKLARVTDPLEQAVKFMEPLKQLAPDALQTHLLGYEIYWRRRKPLILLRHVKELTDRWPDHPKVHEALVKFCIEISLCKDSLDPIVVKVITKVMEPIIRERTPEQINNDYLENHRHNLPSLLQAARVMYKLDRSTQKEAIKIATNLTDGLDGITWQNCAEVIAAMRDGDFGQCENEIESYRAKCYKRFPRAVAFFPKGKLGKATTAAYATTGNKDSEIEETGSEELSNISSPVTKKVDAEEEFQEKAGPKEIDDYFFN